jgi:hypothetical protein
MCPLCGSILREIPISSNIYICAKSMREYNKDQTHYSYQLDTVDLSIIESFFIDNICISTYDGMTEFFDHNFDSICTVNKKMSALDIISGKYKLYLVFS